MGQSKCSSKEKKNSRSQSINHCRAFRHYVAVDLVFVMTFWLDVCHFNILVMCDDSFIWFRWCFFSSLLLSLLPLLSLVLLVLHDICGSKVNCLSSLTADFIHCLIILSIFYEAASLHEEVYIYIERLFVAIASSSLFAPKSSANLNIRYKIYNGFHFTVYDLFIHLPLGHTHRLLAKW